MAVINERRESSGIWIPRPLDGGWGWVIVVASFFANFVWGGLFNSYGILYKEFLIYFGQSRGYTSLIGSVVNGIGYGGGIVASALMNRYGIRSVAIIGGVIGGISCALCTFADSILALILLFGVGVGLGHALNYTAAYIIVPYYFEKRRGMATGMAIAGSGIGNIVCAPLMRYLLLEYTWRGFVIIQGGLILQCCVFAALFRPVPLVRVSSSSQTSLKEETHEENVESTIEHKHDQITNTNGSVISPQSIDPHRVSRSRKYSDISEYHRKTRSTTIESVLPPIPESNVPPVSPEQRRNRLHSQQLGRTFSLDGTNLTPTVGKPVKHPSGPFLRKDIYYANSLEQLHEYRSNPRLYWQSALSIQKLSNGVDDSHLPLTDADVEDSALGATNKSHGRSKLSDALGLDLLRRTEFLTFALAIFALYCGYYVPYTVLYDFALEKGLGTNNAVILVSIMGVANTLGRVVLGSVADLRCVNRIMFFSFIVCLMGVATCFCYFYTDFFVLAVYSAIFAACVGASKAMTLIVTVDLMGLENLTNAYGILLLFQGFGFILGNPLAGWLHDLTRNYVVPFTMIGAVLIISGVLILISPRMKKRDNRYFANLILNSL